MVSLEGAGEIVIWGCVMVGRNRSYCRGMEEPDLWCTWMSWWPICMKCAVLLDNCNSLYGISKHLLHRLQLVQNAAARTVCRIPKYDHITPSFRMLHWLPNEQRIIFKVCLLTWKARHGNSPQYIQDLLTTHDTHSRGLRSANQNLQYFAFRNHQLKHLVTEPSL